jgi:hypothetical protein
LHGHGCRKMMLAKARTGTLNNPPPAGIRPGENPLRRTLSQRGTHCSWNKSGRTTCSVICHADLGPRLLAPGVNGANGKEELDNGGVAGSIIPPPELPQTHLSSKHAEDTL